MGIKAMLAARTWLPRRATVMAATIAGVAGATVLLAACGSSSSSSSAARYGGGASASPAASTSASAVAAGTAVLKTEHSTLGTVLADSQGMTVYWFAADHGDTSACNGACAAAWPPVIGTPQAATGVTLTGALGTITRSGGQKQATYNGHPLYTFRADTAPGQVNGNKVNGFGAEWYAITIGASSGASTAPTSAGGGGGY